MEFIDVTWDGSARDFVSTIGRFKRGHKRRISKADAEWLLTLSEGWKYDDEVYDERSNVIGTFEPSDIGILSIKPDPTRKTTLAFGREYGWGDMILAAYFACRSAKLQDPRAEVTFFVPLNFVDFFRQMDFLDHVEPYPPNFKNQRDYDKYLDLTRVPEFHSAEKQQSRPDVFASVIANPTFEFEAFRPPREALDEASAMIRSRNSKNRKIIGLAPISNSAIRTYPPEHFRKLVEYYAKKYFVILFGQDKYGWGLKQWNFDNVFSLVDQTPDLVKLSAVMSGCNFAICTDHGLLHLFGILKVPTLALFGNIDPSTRIKYYPTINALFPKGELPCIPCHDKMNPCPKTDAPFGGACLQLLKPGKVIEVFEDTIVQEPTAETEEFRRIMQLYEKSQPRIITRFHPYVPSKTPLKEKSLNRVLIVVPHIFMGGGETQLLYLLNALDNTGFDFELVVMGMIDDELFPKLADRYHITILNSETRENVKLLRSKIKEYEPDILLFHGTDMPTYALVGVERKPIMIQILHTGFGYWTEDVLRVSERFNDHAIAVAPWIRRKFMKVYPDLRFSTVLNGVPVPEKNTGKSLRKEWGAETADFLIGCMSRFSGEKRLELLIDALRELPSHVKLVLAGWGKAEHDLKQKSLELNGRVIFPGVVHDRASFFKTIDCAALVSDMEGNSMFILEAAMARKAIITTKVGAAPEIFRDYESAIFVDSDPKSISDAVVSLISNANFKDSLGEKAYEIIYKVSSDVVMAQGYRSIFLSEIERRQNPDSILIFRGGGMGDILMLTAMIRWLRHKYPRARIVVATSEYYADVLEGNPMIDFVIKKSDFDFNKSNHHFDLAFNCGHYEVWQTHEHIIEHYLRLAGCDDPVFDRALEVNLDGVKNHGPGGDYVCIHTRSNFECKNWGSPPEWQKVVDHLKRSHTVVQVGDHLEPFLGTVSVAGKLTPRETMKVLEGAKFFVGIDSFPIHGAKAVECPTVAIYGGSSHPDFCGYDDNVNVVSSCPCRCDLSKSGDRYCNKGLACLAAISVDDVINAIKTLEAR